MCRLLETVLIITIKTMKYYDVNTREIFPGGRGERREESLFKT